MKRIVATFTPLAMAYATFGLPGQYDMIPTVDIRTGKGQGHGKPGTRPKAERNVRRAKRRQRAKGRR